LGLHVVQSPDAVADTQDGDELTFDPDSRRLTNVTRGKTYDPVPLTPKEDEIRRSGGIFAIGRREFRDATARRPPIPRPDAGTARAPGSRTAGPSLRRHCWERPSAARPAPTLGGCADRRPGSDRTPPCAIHTFEQITGGKAIWPRQIAIANDHFVFTGVEADD